MASSLRIPLPPRSSTPSSHPPTPTLLLFPGEDDGDSLSSSGVSVSIDGEEEEEFEAAGAFNHLQRQQQQQQQQPLLHLQHPLRPPSPAISIDSALDEPLDASGSEGGGRWRSQAHDHGHGNGHNHSHDHSTSGHYAPTRSFSPHRLSPLRNGESAAPGGIYTSDPSTWSNSLPRRAGFLHPDMATEVGAGGLGLSVVTAAGTGQSGRPTTPPPPRANPFNFQTQFITTSPVKTQTTTSQRRGHRYKHSSISTSHNLIPLPPPRPPLALPASLPIPTVREAWRSLGTDQRRRLAWCVCHALVAVGVFFASAGSLATTALSHLVFFDVGSAAVCVVVDALGNFEAWRRSSIRHPFGLARAEVLAGFAMSVFLVFGGFDLASHDLKHVLESVGSHEPHRPHEHAHAAAHHHDQGQPHHHAGHSHGPAAVRIVAPGSVDWVALAAAVSTLISAYGLQNHARVSRVMARASSWRHNTGPRPAVSSSYPAKSGSGGGLVATPPEEGFLATLLPDVLANPFHFLTLSSAAVMLLLPLLSVSGGPNAASASSQARFYAWADRLLCLAIAASMFVLGVRLARAQGLMLLMSYGGGSSSSSSSSSFAASNSAVSALLADVAALEPRGAVLAVEKARIWQAHYGLGVATMRLVVSRAALLPGGGSTPVSATSTASAAASVQSGGSGGGQGGGGGAASVEPMPVVDEALDAAVARLRNRVVALVRNRLGEGYGRGGSLRWEVTVEVRTEP